MRSPSYREIANALKLKSVGSAFQLVMALEEKGFIVVLANRRNGIIPLNGVYPLCGGVQSQRVGRA